MTHAWLIVIIEISSSRKSWSLISQIIAFSELMALSVHEKMNCNGIPHTLFNSMKLILQHGREKKLWVNNQCDD